MGRMQRCVAGMLVLAASGLCRMPAASAENFAQPSAAWAWIIEDATYTGDVRDRIVRFEARYQIRVLQRGWVQVPLAISGATITAARVQQGGRAAHLMPMGDAGYAFVAEAPGKYTVVLTGAHRLIQEPQFEGVALGIPRATYSTWTLSVPRQDVELRPDDQLRVEVQPDGRGVKLIARLAGSDRMDIRWRTKPAAPVMVEPVVYGDVQTLLTIDEQVARLAAMIDYRVAQGQVRELQIRLPGEVSLLNVRGAGIADWRVVDGAEADVLHVTLEMPLPESGYRLVLEGERALPEQATTLALPEIQLVNVKQERGHIAVSRTGSVELAVQESDSLHRVDIRELPELLQAPGAGPVLAFSYHQHPYRAVLQLVRHEDHPVLAAIAEQAELLTVIAPSGELLTRAVYLIKANKKQFLDVRLPDGARLWSCLVDRRTVKPVQGEAGHLRVPLDGVDGRDALPVELVYFEHRPALVRIGDLQLRGPVLDVPTTVANWTLYAPQDVRFLRTAGNLAKGAAAFVFADDAFAAEPLVSEPMPALARSKSDLMAKMSNRVAGLFERRGDRDNEGAADAVSTNAPAPVSLEQAAGSGGMKRMLDAMQETGILPLKIRLPKAGRCYRFNRLMTDGEALEFSGTFVHLPMPWVGLAALLLILPIGGFAALRLRRA